MVELPVQPYVFVKELMVVQKILDIFGVVIELMISLKFTEIVLPLLGARIKDIKSPYADRKDRDNGGYPRLFPRALTL